MNIIRNRLVLLFILLNLLNLAVGMGSGEFDSLSIENLSPLWSYLLGAGLLAIGMGIVFSGPSFKHVLNISIFPKETDSEDEKIK